jgi:hypothetical protein
LAGLYQVNFTVPSSGLTNGDVMIAFETNEALNEMATISLSGFSLDEARTVARRRSRLRPVAAGATYVRPAKKVRRALPER